METEGDIRVLVPTTTATVKAERSDSKSPCQVARQNQPAGFYFFLIFSAHSPSIQANLNVTLFSGFFFRLTNCEWASKLTRDGLVHQ